MWPAWLQREAGVHLAERVPLSVDGADGHGPVVRAVASKLRDVAGNLKGFVFVFLVLNQGSVNLACVTAILIKQPAEQAKLIFLF